MLNWSSNIPGKAHYEGADAYQSVYELQEAGWPFWRQICQIYANFSVVFTTRPVARQQRSTAVDSPTRPIAIPLDVLKPLLDRFKTHLPSSESDQKWLRNEGSNSAQLICSYLLKKNWWVPSTAQTVLSYLALVYSLMFIVQDFGQKFWPRP